jgi:hypothetical protein
MNPEELELGIVAVEKRISAEKCLKRMQQLILLPMLLFIVAAYGLVIAVLFVTGNAQLPIETWTELYPGQFWKVMAYTLLLVGGLIPLIPAIAWVWWAAQKWRIWALQNVDNWPQLEQECEKKSGKWPRRKAAEQAGASADRILEHRLITYRDRHDKPR